MRCHGLSMRICQLLVLFMLQSRYFFPHGLVKNSCHAVWLNLWVRNLLSCCRANLVCGLIESSLARSWNSMSFWFSSNFLFFLSSFISIFCISEGIRWLGTSDRCFCISATSSRFKPGALGSSFILKYFTHSRRCKGFQHTDFFFLRDLSRFWTAYSRLLHVV